MKRIFINGIIVTMNEGLEVYEKGYVVTEGTRILETGPMEKLDLRKLGAEHMSEGGEEPPDPAKQSDRGDPWLCDKVTVIDTGRAIVMPGFVNTHCHMGMIPFRGLGDDCEDRLRRFLLPMELTSMDRELAAVSSRYALCEMLLSGTTTVMDMYYFEDEAAQVMDQMGLRGIAGETVMEEATCDAAGPEAAIRLGQELMEQYEGHPRIRGCLAPHGTTTCSGRTLKKIYDLDRRYGSIFTLHAAEMDYELNYLKDVCKSTPVEYLEKLDLLGETTLLAHSIRVTAWDRQLLKITGARVAHCIGSNTKAAKGVAPVTAMKELGITVGLGTDGPASGNTLDMFTQMKLCANFHKNQTGDRSAFPAREIVAMATIEGAKALGLGHLTGSLEAGKEADMILVETDSPNMFPVYDPYSALVYSAQGSNVRDVYVAGRPLVLDKKLVNEDFERVRQALGQKMGRTAFAQMGNLIL